jgi:hypothetical protein
LINERINQLKEVVVRGKKSDHPYRRNRVTTEPPKD